jgi:hypothetical protein
LYSFDSAIIEDLSAVSSLYVKGQPWKKSDRDSFPNISFSGDGATRKSLPNYRKLFAILLSPTRPSKDGPESVKMAIFHVMMIGDRVDLWQY